MANCIPFEKLEVGETYYFQSDYWNDVLGTATIMELYPQSGTGWCKPSWGYECCHFDTNEDWMWDEMPTKEEQAIRKSKKYSERYYPPRIMEEVAYSGQEIDEALAKKLDEVIDRLHKIFKDGPFKRDKRDPECEFVWESKLDIPLSELLIRNGGKCDWEVMDYLGKHGGFDFHAGERDSFGWLTGVIEHPDFPNRSIIYG